MGKIRCICDNILSDTCGEDGEAFRQVDSYEGSSAGFEVYREGDGRSILECNKCGCLLIEDPINSNTVKFYKPENGKFNKLFKE
jgi:hypothetical protein